MAKTTKKLKRLSFLPFVLPFFLLGGISAGSSTTTTKVVGKKGEDKTGKQDLSGIPPIAFNLEGADKIKVLKQTVIDFLINHLAIDERMARQLLSEFGKILKFLIYETNITLILEVFVKYLEDTPSDKRPFPSLAFDKQLDRYKDPVPELRYQSPLSSFERRFNSLKKYTEKLFALGLTSSIFLSIGTVFLPLALYNLSCLLDSADADLEKCKVEGSKEKGLERELDSISPEGFKSFSEFVEAIVKIIDKAYDGRIVIPTNLISRLFSLFFFPNTPRKLLENNFAFIGDVEEKIESLERLIKQLRNEKDKRKIITLKKSFIAKAESLEKLFLQEI